MPRDYNWVLWVYSLCFEHKFKTGGSTCGTGKIEWITAVSWAGHNSWRGKPV